jgi:hypothetical protein
MSKHIWLAFLLLSLLISACGDSSAPPPTAQPGSLYVDPRRELGEISPLVYGSNYGPWVAVPLGMMPAVEQAGITVVRWPGGSWGDRNNLKGYQIDQFVAFCQQIGAEPSISVRLMEGTPEAAAELVRYANVEKGYSIRFWSIGNEPTLFADYLQEPYDTERFNQEWRAIAEAMLAVDPEIQLIGPELHQYGADLASTPKDAQGKDWMTEFLRANGDLVDIVSIHRYPFPRGTTGTPVTIDDLRQNSAEWDDIIPYLRGLIQEVTGREIPIAVTEINTHWSKTIQGEATPDSFYNAIWWADVLGRMINQDVYMVNHWLIVSTGAQGGWGIIDRGVVRPSYYVFMLYQQFGEQQVYAASGVADVSIYAAERADGALTLMVINLADEAQTVALELRGGAPDTAEVWRFDAEHNAENLGTQPLLADALELPGQSITLLVLP